MHAISEFEWIARHAIVYDNISVDNALAVRIDSGETISALKRCCATTPMEYDTADAGDNLVTKHKRKKKA